MNMEKRKIETRKNKEKEKETQGHKSPLKEFLNFPLFAEMTYPKRNKRSPLFDDGAQNDQIFKR